MEATQLAASPHRRLQESGRPVQPAGRFSLSLSLCQVFSCRLAGTVAWSDRSKKPHGSLAVQGCLAH